MRSLYSLGMLVFAKPVRLCVWLRRSASAAIAVSLSISAIAIGMAQANSTSPEELLKANRYVEARAAYEAILDADPGNREAQRGEVAASEAIAIESRNGGRADDALRALMRAQTYAPENQRLLFDLSIQQDQMRLYRDADETLTTLEKLEQSNPSESPGPQVLYAIARVKMDLGQLDVAEEKLTAYLKTHPQDASAHYGMGRVYQLGLNFDKARAEFQRSIELQPLQTEAYYQLGVIALGQESLDEAIADFAKTLARNPKHGGALAGTGEAYFKEKQYKQAQDFLNRAVEAAPDYESGHYYLGLTLVRLGRKEDGQRELELATQLAGVTSKQERGRFQQKSERENPQ